MSIIYSEPFEAYTTGSALTANPPNFVTTASNGTWTVESGFGSNSAANLTTVNWSHAMFNGASYTYTDLTVRCKQGARATIFTRVTALSGVNSIPTDGYQLQSFPAMLTLYRGGYAVSLGTWAFDPANVNDFQMRLLCNGNQISAYIDGVLRIGPVTDATYASGKVGFGTFGGTTSRWDDITVDDGVAVDTISTGGGTMMSRRAVRRRK